MPTATKAVPLIKFDLPLLEETSDWSGETTRLPRLEVPQIRVSYKAEDDPQRVAPKGEFIEYNPATKETRVLGKKVEGVQILHHRQQVSLTTDTKSYRSPEVSMKAKEYTLLCFTKDVTGKTKTSYIGKDGLDALRASSPELAKLRYERVLYVIHDGILKKLTIYGASFGQFINFSKELHGQSSTSVRITLTTTKEKKGINIYYPVVFTANEKSDKAIIDPPGKALADWFAKYDELNAKQQADKEEQAAVDRGDAVPLTSKEIEEALDTSKTISEQVTDDEKEPINEADLDRIFPKTE